MGDRGHLSARAEDYLKTLLFLTENEGKATSKRVCTELGITPGTVTAMFRKLATDGLINYSPYGEVLLTATGRRRALETVRHHRLIETFLHRTLRYPLHRVHDEADALEHAISEEFEERVASLLGHPAFDPHGSPIPDRNGGCADDSAGALPLTMLKPNDPAAIFALRHRDPQQLRYLERNELVPGTALSVIERKPFRGPLIVRVVEGAPLAIGYELAAKIMVRLSGKVVKT